VALGSTCVFSAGIGLKGRTRHCCMRRAAVSQGHLTVS
jgi:hypothetical protein